MEQDVPQKEVLERHDLVQEKHVEEDMCGTQEDFADQQVQVTH